MATIEQHVPKIKEKINGFTSGANTFLEILGSTAGLNLDLKQNEKDDAFSKAIAPLAGIAGGIATQGLSSMFTKTPPKAKYGMGFRNNLVNKPSGKTVDGRTHSQGGEPFMTPSGELIEVEDNEFITDDYVYSDAIGNDGYAKKGEKKVKESFADKARKISGKYKSNDSLSISAKRRELSKLADSNDKVRGMLGLDNPQYAFGGMDLDPTRRGYVATNQFVNEVSNLPSTLPDISDPEFNKSLIGEFPQAAILSKKVALKNQKKALNTKFTLPEEDGIIVNPGVPLDNVPIPGPNFNTQKSSEEVQRLSNEALNVDFATPFRNSESNGKIKKNNNVAGEYTRSFLPQAIGYGVQALANLPGLFTKPETVKYDRVTPETVDLTAQRTSIDRDRDLQIALARRAGGNSNNMAQTMNFLAGANQGIFRETGARKGESFMNQENINAEIRNKAGMFNAELSQREADANSAERDAARGIKMQSLSNIGTIAALTGKSYDALQNDIEMIQSWGRTGDFGISNKGIGRNPDGTIYKFGGRIGKSKKC